VIATFVFSCGGSKKIIGNKPVSLSHFNTVQSKLITSADAKTPMRVFKINNKTDSILLRQKCEDVVVTPNDPMLKLFTDRLLTTVRDSMSLGVGIAAPQVGILKNIIWVQRFDKAPFPFECYINPKITKYTVKKQDCKEGCLSIPDKSATTTNRAYAILLEYDKLDGTHHIEMIEDFTAVIFQHEIDHLSGILFTDYLEE
jgi:N-formylmethionyl-tRNA deformylase